MKITNHFTAIVTIVFLAIIFALIFRFFPGSALMMSVMFILPAFMLFNLAVRKSLAYKGYFTSPSNIFTTKFRDEIVFEIPADLMFEKVIEVLKEKKSHKLTLVDMNEEDLELLAITQLSIFSWGENIYIDFEETNGETTMKFCSTTMFQIYDWGKNEKNYKKLFNEIENSLTI